MRDLNSLEFHPSSEQLVSILSTATRNSDLQFFRVLVAYQLCKIAASMRASIKTKTRNSIPVNLFAINLAPSGYGKGLSTNIMEDYVCKGFRDKFMNETFDEIAEVALARLANRRCAQKDTDEEEELSRVRAEFAALGEIAYSFDSGSTPAVKQMRYKLLMAGAGAINLEIDEIGSNLLGNVEVLNSFMELYDVGKIKQKLTKNTVESSRGKDLDGRTPTNAMLYGTPSKLLNGSKTEEEFYSFLEAGYARRSLFGFARTASRMDKLTAAEIYDRSTDPTTDPFVSTYAGHLESLASYDYFDRELDVTKDVEIAMIEYSLHCEQLADAMGEHDEIRKAEMTHRYFRALKLAGAYAFVDGSHTITEDHLYYGIALVEASGKAFSSLLTRERNYVKLARYLAEIRKDVTHVDLVEDLPFFKGSQQQKTELLQLATAWGYKNNVIIKKSYTDGIEFLRGESLEETDLSKMIVSYSTDIVRDYLNDTAPFDQLHKLTTAPGLHWVNHHLYDGYRKEENAEVGFNMVVIDVDNGLPISTAQMLLKDYKFLMYTTKRHTEAENRYRIIFPINYTLKLDATDYKEFMNNIFEWLPLEPDTATGQRARKWLSHDGDFIYNDGELLDVLPFIPKTSKNELRKQQILDTRSMSNLERWFANNTSTGNRSKQLIRYAFILVDSGADLTTVREKIMSLNNKLPDKLTEAEILSTIMVTAAKSISSRQAA